jgi:hypothetical protein
MTEQKNPWQDALAAIDLAAIDSLKTLKREQDVLEQRLDALDQVKSDFAAAVYQRVRDDYVKRARSLEDQAAPLKQAARVEYAKLRELYERFEADHEAIKLDQQELTLRHKLGEFDDPEFARRSAAIEGTLKDRAAAHEQAQGLKARFLEAFRNEAELNIESEAVRAAAAIGAPAPAGGQFTTQQFGTLTANSLAEARTNEIAAVQSSAPPNKTQVMTPIPETVINAVGGATQVFRAARLVPQNPEAGKQSFSLALKPTHIGSDAGSEIRLMGPGVDAKHAQIAVSMGGFTIVDLGSKHGTRVNAEKIRERQLRHEDVIQIGAARFVFREG